MALNDDIADRIIARNLMLQRLGASERKKVLKLMREMEEDLTRLIIRIDPTGATAPSYKIVRLEKLVKQATETIRANYKTIRDQHQDTAYQLAKAETDWFVKAAHSEIGVNIVTTELSAPQLRAIASDTLISGSPAKEWWSRQAGNLQRRFADTVRDGMLKGQTTPEIVRRVRGTKAAGYADGIMQASRSQAESLVRTSVQTVANEARDQMYEENSDIIKGIQWVSTLDNRTSEICMALSGLTWTLPDYDPVGHDIDFPGPTAHFGCRSTQVAVFKSFKELSGDRSVTTEAGGKSNMQAIFERNLREAGVPEDKIAKAVFDARSSMDGQVARDLTFDAWLKGKPESFQNEMLGVGKAELWRDGKITLTDLVDQSARPLTLEQLKNLS